MLRGNELEFDSSCAAAADGSQANVTVEMLYSASDVTTVTLEANGNWGSTEGSPSVTNIAGIVGDALVHVEIAHGQFRDLRTSASIQVEPGATVDVYVEAVYGSGAGGGGRAVTMTFDPSP